MTRRAVFVDPAPERVTPSKLRAELLAAGVPLEPIVAGVALDCYHADTGSGRVFAVIIDADTDQWDALTRQVVGAHVPDELLTPIQHKKQQVVASLSARDVQSVRLRATLKLIMSVFIETRAAINKLTRELSDAGLNVTQTKLTNRSWEQLEAALATLAEIEVDQEQTHIEVNP